MKASRGHQDSFRSFCRIIERNLSESGLTPAAVAAEHGVSLRYLHLVFAEQGTTFGKFLRRTRLARCHRELSQSFPGKTITQIAFRWGFNDVAHFSRSFKAEFGSSPRVVSQEALWERSVSLDKIELHGRRAESHPGIRSTDNPQEA